jgi:hypothetical protein
VFATAPPRLPKMRFGNWAGGDRDGHPFVTPEVTRLTLDLLRDLVVWQNDRTQKARIKFPIYSCGPAKWNPGDWDNMSDEVQIESLELAIWFFDRE